MKRKYSLREWIQIISDIKNNPPEFDDFPDEATPKIQIVEKPGTLSVLQSAIFTSIAGIVCLIMLFILLISKANVPALPMFTLLVSTAVFIFLAIVFWKSFSQTRK